jgi:hypothetical protein
MAYFPLATEINSVYRLAAPDGAVAVFNDPLDPNYVGMLTAITGIDSAEVRESAQDAVEADGGIHGNFYFSRRSIVMDGRVFGHASALERATRLDRARRASMALRGDSTLTWKPSWAQENLVANPRAVTDTTGWTQPGGGTNIAAGGTITRATGVSPPVGTTAVQIATSGSGNANQGVAYGVAVTAGKTYSISVAARRSAGTASGDVVVAGVHSATLGTLTSTTWNTYTLTFTAASSGTVYVGVRQANSNTTTSTYQVTDAMVAPGSSTAYFDGDTAGYAWQGDAGVSVSGNYVEMRLPVRRQGRFTESGAWVKDFQIPLVSAQAVIESNYIKTVASGVATENRGNYAAYPVFRITGASTNPTVTHASTGVFRTTGLTLAAGEVVEFDMLRHTGVFTAGVRNGQSANQYINWATTAWPYLPGAANSTFTLAGGGTLAVVYRDTWA